MRAHVCDRAYDRARDLTSLVSRSGAASPGGRLGASRQARQGRGSTPRGARARGSGLGCFATSGVSLWAGRRDVWDGAGVGLGRGVWDGVCGTSGTRPARGFGPPLAGCRDGVWWGVWCRVGVSGGVCGVGCRAGFRDENGTFCRKIDVPKMVQKWAFGGGF